MAARFFATIKRPPTSVHDDPYECGWGLVFRVRRQGAQGLSCEWTLQYGRIVGTN